MSTFDCLATATPTTLTIDRAPIIVDRYGDRGKRTAVATNITGCTRIVVESTGTPDDALLILRFTKLTQAQAETLSDICDEGGTITTRLDSGGATFSAVIHDGPHLEAIIGDHPDGDRTGANLTTDLTWYRAEVTLYRI